MDFFATVGKDKDGNVRIRVAKGGPKWEDGVVERVEVLQGNDEQELMQRAMKFAQERVS